MSMSLSFALVVVVVVVVLVVLVSVLVLVFASVHTSHMSKVVMVTCVQIKCYAVDCLGTYFTHVQSSDVTRVQSATQWTASVQTSHMSKAVM